MDVMGEVARFCRARQKYCHHAQSVPQVALFYSQEAIYREWESVYNPGVGNFWVPIRGVLDVLLDGQWHTDVVLEHQLKGQCSKYPVIVFPEWKYVAPEMRAELVEYVNQGGNLLIIGPKSVELFKEQLNLTSFGAVEQQTRWLHYDGVGSGMKADMAQATVEPDTQVMGLLIQDDYPPAGGWPAASIHKIGKGKIAAVYTELGRTYYNETTTVVRDFISAVMRELLPEPVVEVRGSHRVDVVVNRIKLDGKQRLAVNLINMAGPHRDVNVYTFDDIPPVGPLAVQIRLDQKPQRIVRQPGDEEMSFDYQDGAVTMLVPNVKIYDIYVVY